MSEHELILSANDGWEAACTCGWEEYQLPDQDTAIDAWENHCDVVFMEATGG